MCERFANNSSLFSMVNDIQTDATILSNDLTAISNWDIRLENNF